jgi:putative hemolysin
MGGASESSPMTPAKFREIPVFERGLYRVRAADGARDIGEARALRTRAFRTARPDQDAFDSRCVHMLVEHRTTGALVGGFRMLVTTSGAEVLNSYSAQFYGLAALSARGGTMLELGRFCIHPECHDPDVLRVAWGALTAHVDRLGIDMLFGCSSFAGTNVTDFADALLLLRTYLAMGGWVSDHAVIDRDLGTLHVFTGLEIGAIPPARKRLLRAVAG